MKCKCKRCGYEWETLFDRMPKSCPRIGCRSKKWNSDKIHTGNNGHNLKAGRATGLNISSNALKKRINKWGIEKALTSPAGTINSKRFKILELLGVKKTTRAWSKLCPTSRHIFSERIKNG